MKDKFIWIRHVRTVREWQPVHRLTYLKYSGLYNLQLKLYSWIVNKNKPLFIPYKYSFKKLLISWKTSPNYSSIAIVTRTYVRRTSLFLPRDYGWWDFYGKRCGFLLRVTCSIWSGKPRGRKENRCLITPYQWNTSLFYFVLFFIRLSLTFYFLLSGHSPDLLIISNT